MNRHFCVDILGSGTIAISGIALLVSFSHFRSYSLSSHVGSAVHSFARWKDGKGCWTVEEPGILGSTHVRDVPSDDSALSSGSGRLLSATEQQTFPLRAAQGDGDGQKKPGRIRWQQLILSRRGEDQ